MLSSVFFCLTIIYNISTVSMMLYYFWRSWHQFDDSIQVARELSYGSVRFLLQINYSSKSETLINSKMSHQPPRPVVPSLSDNRLLNVSLTVAYMAVHNHATTSSSRILVEQQRKKVESNVNLDVEGLIWNVAKECSKCGRLGSECSWVLRPWWRLFHGEWLMKMFKPNHHA